MKNTKTILLSFAALLLVLASVFCSCDSGIGNETITTAAQADDTTAAAEKPQILAVAGLSMNGTELTAEVPANDDNFIVDGKLKVTSGAVWAIYTDAACTEAVDGKTVAAPVGETLYYVRLTLGAESAVYTLKLTRSQPVQTAPAPVETTAAPAGTSSPAGTTAPAVPADYPEGEYIVTDKGAGDVVDYPFGR